MHKALNILLCCLAAFAGGGCSRSTSRADYARATLPYDSAVLVAAARRLRQENPDSKQIVILDEAVLEHLLQLHVCLSDPTIPEQDKKYARNVFPRVAAYAAAHDLVDDCERGKEYKMLTDDLVLPKRMAIRDVVDQIVKEQLQGQQNGAANGSQPIRSETNSTSSAAGSRR